MKKKKKIIGKTGTVFTTRRKGKDAYGEGEQVS
jgi:hypothetical protein